MAKKKYWAGYCDGKISATAEQYGGKDCVIEIYFRKKPELRLVVSNGKTLCQDCHNKVHQGLIEYYRQQSILRDMAHSV